jgi:hypothetical protein
MMRGKSAKPSKKIERSENYPILEHAMRWKAEEGFVAHLLRYPGFPKQKKNAWEVLEIFVTELSNASKKMKQLLEHRFCDLVSYYYRMCCEHHAAYITFAMSTSTTSHFIFRLRKCIHGESELRLSSGLINGLMALIASQVNVAEPKHLCDTLLGVGYLAEFHRLDGQIDARIINNLLAALVEKCADADPKYSCNALLGLGHLALRGQLQGAVESSLVNQLLYDLIKKVASLACWQLGNAFLGVGNLIKQGRLSGPLDPQFVATALSTLVLKRTPDRSADLANGLLGLGYYAMYSQFSSEIEWQNVVLLINTVSGKRAKRIPGELCRVLLGAAYFAHCCPNRGSLNAQTVNDALKELLDEDTLSADDLSNGILAAGYLARLSNLSSKVDMAIVHQCFQKLSYNSKNLMAEHLCNFLMGMVWLARENCLEGRLDAKFINLMLSALADRGADARSGALCEVLVMVKDLIQQNCINGEVKSECINLLLAALSKKLPLEIPEIYFAILNLVDLGKHHRLEGQLSASVINSLLEILAKLRHMINPVNLCTLLLTVDTLSKLHCLEGAIDPNLRIGLLANLPGILGTGEPIYQSLQALPLVKLGEDNKAVDMPAQNAGEQRDAAEVVAKHIDIPKVENTTPDAVQPDQQHELMNVAEPASMTMHKHKPNEAYASEAIATKRKKKPKKIARDNVEREKRAQLQASSRFFDTINADIDRKERSKKCSCLQLLSEKLSSIYENVSSPFRSME